jgi:hypothetical protein
MSRLDWKNYDQTIAGEKPNHGRKGLETTSLTNKSNCAFTRSSSIALEAAPSVT